MVIRMEKSLLQNKLKSRHCSEKKSLLLSNPTLKDLIHRQIVFILMARMDL